MKERIRILLDSLSPRVPLVRQPKKPYIYNPQGYMGIPISNANLRRLLDGDLSYLFAGKFYGSRAIPGARFYVKETLEWNGDQIVYRVDGVPLNHPHPEKAIRNVCPPGFMPAWAKRFDLVVEYPIASDDNGKWMQVRLERIIR